MYLHITGKRNDGYHTLDTVMQSVDLFNTITLEKADKISLTCSDKTVPTDETNTAYKAAQNFPGAYIHIEKGIPHQAGLGSASADAAAVLVGLNKIYNKYSEKELFEIATKIGADVPFFIHGGCQKCEGIGEILSPAKKIDGYYLIVKPSFGISTKEAYSNFDKGLFLNETNNLTPKDYPVPNMTMTGSGSACFKVYKTKAEASASAKRFSDYPFVKIVTPKDYSLEFIEG